MRVFICLCFVFGMICLVAVDGASAEQSLQSRIDALAEGDTLFLEEGIYQEAIVLNKPIQLSGENGTIFQSCSSKPVITLTGKNITIRGITITSCQSDLSPSVIYVSGQNHTLEDIRIDSRSVGIQFDQVEHSNVQNINISGENDENGLDLWQSHNNSFAGIHIDHVQDGIYMENSNNNSFNGNTIQNSRYGFHVMFSDNITIKQNISKHNFTGAMIMESNHSLLEENQLIENNQNVNSQGLLLYNVYDSIIRKNTIIKNRVGMYIEDSKRNEISSNTFTANYIGAQITNTENNRITNNSFTGNVSEIQAHKADKNMIENNYWDSALKLDTDGDGKSNLFYRADPYFLNLTMDISAYQLFFQHPGMLVLQKMLKSPEEQLVTDVSPLMQNTIYKKERNDTNQSFLWTISLIMISGSLLCIYFGRRKI